VAKDTLSDVAGLPEELGIDEDFAHSQQRLTVRAESRRYGKPMTVVSGFDPDLTDESDLKELASELKSQVGAGGTVSDGTIEVQGDHANRIPDLLRERGFEVA
jgi:translation initiation factor 1